jgi:internalin A
MSLQRKIHLPPFFRLRVTCTMRRNHTYFTIICLVLAVCLSGCGSGGPLEPRRASSLGFADEALEAAVREAVGKPTGNLLPSDVEALRWLSATRRGITDLAGIENLPGLKSLLLSDNSIADIGPLSKLTSLELLYLNGNSVRSLSPLSELTALRNLDLTGNQVDNLSPLSQLSGLEILYLNRNRVEDIAALSGLKALEILYLSDNLVESLVPLTDLRTLNTLNLGNNQIREILPLRELPHLVYVSLQGNQINDISALVTNLGIGYFDTVVLTDNPLTDYALSVQIPAIRARRVTVVLDDPIDL